MPFEIIYFKKGHAKKEYAHYMIKNIEKDLIIKNKHFKTKQTAINAAINMMNYLKEPYIIKGNLILKKPKTKQKK